MRTIAARFCWALLLSAVLDAGLSAEPAKRTVHPSSFRAIVTAYCQRGLTKSGVPAAAGIAAADPRVLPLGSVVHIAPPSAYAGTYRVMDTGALVKGRHLDVFVASCRVARRLGRRAAIVHVTSLPR